MNREAFIGRVRARLGHSENSAPPLRGERAPTASALARGTPAELAVRFQVELERVGGAVKRCGSPVELESRLIEFLLECGTRSAVSFGKSAFEEFRFAQLWRELPAAGWERGGEACAASFRARAAAADAGISVADLGVAATGSLLFLSAAARPRSVTLLPRSHVAILRVASLVPDLESALEWLSSRGLPPSSALFVTGPSRTSDIENDLTLGVHGPAAVTVFLLEP